MIGGEHFQNLVCCQFVCALLICFCHSLTFELIILTEDFFITVVLVKFSGMLCHVSWYIVTIQHVITPLKACIFSIAPVIPSNLI